MAIDWVSVIFYFALTVITLYYLTRKRRENYPPGPLRLPGIGNVLAVGPVPHLAFAKYAKKYGPIFSVSMFGEDIVVLNGAKLIKEALNNPALSGRHENKEALELFLTGGKNGIVMSTGKPWTERRRFVLRQLRNFGFGKASMEGIIMDEVKELINWIKKQNGNPVSLHRKFSLAMINSLWTIFSGERFDLDDAELVSILDQQETTSNLLFGGKGKSLVIFFFPTISKLFPNWSGWNHLKELLVPRQEMFFKVIREHERTISDGEPRDFIDSFLMEVPKTEDPTSSFHKSNADKVLPGIMADLFLAGTDTSSNSASCAVLYLIHYQEIQKKLQAEIDSVVGKSRFPSLTDRDKMPYTEAFIMETMRMSSILPTGVPRRVLQDIELGGYSIPKDTIVFPNLHLAHHDPAVWGDPENFRPERFLSQDGKKALPHESLLPFQAGKRICPGETLAQHQIFLFITSILQRFEITAETGKPKPTLEPKVGQVVYGTEPYNAVLTDRQP